MSKNLRSLKAMVSVINPSAVNNEIFKGVKIPYKRKKETNPRKKYKHDEQDLSRLIQEDLKLLEFHNDIIHWDRQNCGKVQTTFGYWIRLLRTGTPDLYFMLPDKLMVYIETKAKTGQSKEQKEFQLKVERAGHRYYIVDSWNKWLFVKKNNLLLVDKFI